MAIDSYILGDNFTKLREEKGFTRQQLAHKLCCSKFQIQEIEEGGQSSFYNESQKLVTAKKMAKLLGLSDELAFTTTPLNIKAELGIHHFYGNENRPLPITNSSWRYIGTGVVIATLFAYSMWGILSADLPQSVSMVTETKNQIVANPELESEIALAINEAHNSEIVEKAPLFITDPCQMTYQYTNAFVPLRANFSGNFVVFVSKEEQAVCVLDGKGEKQLVKIVPGQNKVVSGIGPFTIVGQHLAQIDTYFQGWKVTNLSTQTDSIILKETPVQTAAESQKPALVNQTKETVTTESNGFSRAFSSGSATTSSVSSTNYSGQEVNKGTLPKDDRSIVTPEKAVLPE